MKNEKVFSFFRSTEYNQLTSESHFRYILYIYMDTIDKHTRVFYHIRSVAILTMLFPNRIITRRKTLSILRMYVLLCASRRAVYFLSSISNQR